MRELKKKSMPTNHLVYAGYIVLLAPTVYWLSWLLHFFGLGFFLHAILSLPRYALLTITVIFPSVSFIVGAITYLVHPMEKRKLAYQSLISVSMVYVLLIIIQLIDGNVM